MPDTVTFDHYEVLIRDDGSLFELGRGAMGVTYKAYDTSLRIPVALKVIAGNYLNSETARGRFVREARSAARLRHRNVASVFHLGTEGETWFYAMEYIDGETLEALIKRQGPLSPVLALQITDQVARALNAAQQHGLVHRDIKPANLMLVREDDELVVKVIDFGLARTEMPEGEDAVTMSMGGFVGTPHFASPEQLEEKEVDVRTDIYSLGVTLWYMLAGRAPFAGSMAQVMSQQLSKPPPFEQFTNLPEPLAALLRRMLEKDPRNRPQSPAVLRQEIEACIRQIADSPVAAASVAGDEENLATLFDDVQQRAAESAWETGATIARRYRIVESRGDSQLGTVYRAHDSESKREVRLLRLKPELLAQPQAVTQVEMEVEKIMAVEHPNLLRLYGFETIEGTSYVAMEWTDGFTLLELLRARRELPAGEVLPILRQAAAGADAAWTAGLQRIDFALHQVRFHFPSDIDPERLLRTPVTAWPHFTLKLNPLGITNELAQSATWSGAQTVVGGGPVRVSAAGAAAVSAVPALAAVIYEALGGTARVAGGSAPGYTPLAALSEEGNTVLRRALDPAKTFPSAEEFCQALASLSDLETKRQAPAAAEPRAAVAPSRPAAPPPLPPKKRAPLGAVLGAVGALVLVGGIVWFSRGDKPPKPDTASTEVTPEVTPDVTPGDPDPEPPPVPPKREPPAPTREEILRAALLEAEKLEAAQEWPEALEAYVKLSREGDINDAAKTRAEMLVSRLANAPKLLTPERFAAMRPALTDAAKIDVLSAMVMLAQQLSTADPVEAFAWCSAAAARGHGPSLTQLGRMLAKGKEFGFEPDLVKAVACFEAAVEQGDVAGKVMLGECLLLGKGTVPNPKRAILLLREAADQGSAAAMSKLGDCYRRGTGGLQKDLDEARHFFERAADLSFTEAIGNLGVLYINGEGVKRDPEKAAALFLRGAQAGDANCMFFYAGTVEGGGIPGAGKADALKWYRKAAEAGHARAIEWRNQHDTPGAR
jgi:serine/threonine protein kinase/TPR repeat protein